MRKTAAVVDMIYATAERYSLRLYLKEHYPLIFHTQRSVIYMNIVPHITFIRLPYTGHILKWKTGCPFASGDYVASNSQNCCSTYTLKKIPLFNWFAYVYNITLNKPKGLRKL